MQRARPTLISQLMPRVLFARRLKRRAGRRVLLTFDDGPHPETTPAVLDVLDAYSARAVFFVVGNRIDRAPQMLRRIVERGHMIGNHSQTHPLDGPLPYGRYVEDVRLCQDKIYESCAFRPRLHRPPLGTISWATAVAPKRLGLKNVLWSYSSEDWRFRADEQAALCAEAMSRAVRPRDILLFHDERAHTVVALERLLPELRSRGLDLDAASLIFL